MKVSLVTLGCDKNTVDSERYLAQLVAHGAVPTDDPSEAEVVIVNTCGFIDAAKKESIDALVEAGKLKSDGACQAVVAVGCMVQRHKSELVDALPPDWSHALVHLTLDSSDYVDRAALLLAPANPQLVDGRSTLQIRAANRVGYGIAAEMLRRCLERLDHEAITGRIEIVQAVSDAHPVATQGPVFRLGGRSV